METKSHHTILYKITGPLIVTKRERLKSALKKRKVFKIVKGGDPFGFFKIQFVAKYQKN